VRYQASELAHGIRSTSAYAEFGMSEAVFGMIWKAICHTILHSQRMDCIAAASGVGWQQQLSVARLGGN
jgi:hypothetical protein